MKHTPTAEEFETLTKLIRQRTGLAVSDTRTDDVLSAVSKLVAASRLHSVAALLNALRTEPTANQLWQQLVEIITVGETYFFRNEPQFQALRTKIFPALINRRRESGNKYLRLWCAGCATGEEPYSLAILLRELLPDYRTWHITLLATDINTASLEHAKRGAYRAWSFRNETPEDVKDRWFCAEGENYKLQQSIKDMVTFETLNLVSDEYPSLERGISHIDLLMCRNVTIYFDAETTGKIVSRFYESLNNEGWLVVGHAEPTAAIYSAFTPQYFPDTVIYQKLSAQREAPQPTWMDLPVERPRPSARIVDIELVPTRKIAPRPAQATPKELPHPEPEALAQKPTWLAAKAADLEDWHEALILLAKAENQNKFQPQVYYLRAIVQLHLDDLTGAHTSLRQALYCDPQFALAHYTLGELFERTGDYKTAAQHWKSAQAVIADLQPESPLPLGEDLTVEMLQGLLAHALQRTADKGKGAK